MVQGLIIYARWVRNNAINDNWTINYIALSTFLLTAQLEEPMFASLVGQGLNSGMSHSEGTHSRCCNLQLSCVLTFNTLQS